MSASVKYPASRLVCALLLIAGVGVYRLTAAGVPQDQQAAPVAPQTSGEVNVLQLRPDVYMLTVDGVNVGIETGADGTIVVDTGPGSTSGALLAMIQKITSTPIRYVINTSGDDDMVGGNARLVSAGLSLMYQPSGQRPPTDTGVGSYASIVAAGGVVPRMIQQGGYPSWLYPNDAFAGPEFQIYMNDQPVAVIHEPAAHSDADAVVRFERSDVVVAGDIFDITHFPIIDVKEGGTVQGEIAALNDLLNKLVFTSTPLISNTLGTLVIPARGPVCNQADILVYRDMVDTVRKRIQYDIQRGDNLQKVEAAAPTQGYDTRFGSPGDMTRSNQFIEAVYQSLIADKRPNYGGAQ